MFFMNKVWQKRNKRISGLKSAPTVGFSRTKRGMVTQEKRESDEVIFRVK